MIPLSHLFREAKKEYALAPASIDGLSVTSNIPNMASISASLTDYTILKGIRKVPLSDFSYGPHDMFYAKNDIEKSYALAEEIKKNKRIDPLIVAIDKEGPYILEGAHRLVALGLLGVQYFPALVVIDNDS